MNPDYQHIFATLVPVYGEAEAKELALWLLEETTGMSRFEILACKDTKNIPNMEIFLQRILKKEPIQYIFGHTEWAGLDLKLTPDTLIPRPETAELLSYISAPETKKEVSVLDIGTGSGCLAIALKKRHPEWMVTGLDISLGALQIARENAARNLVDIQWIQADILHDEIEGKWDIVVSNPPYICESEKTDMDANVLAYEPHTALFVPDDDPLLFYRQIARLKLAPEVYFEINERMGEEMVKMLDFIGYSDIQIRKDSYGKERMVFGRIAG